MPSQFVIPVLIVVGLTLLVHRLKPGLLYTKFTMVETIFSKILALIAFAGVVLWLWQILNTIDAFIYLIALALTYTGVTLIHALVAIFDRPKRK